MNAVPRIIVVLLLCGVSGVALLRYTQSVYSYEYYSVFDTYDSRKGTLRDYYVNDIGTELAVRSSIKSMTDEEIVGQLFMPAWDTSLTEEQIVNMINTYHLGGLMTLRKGITSQSLQRINRALLYEKENMQLEGLLSIDAEPSLIKYRAPELGSFSNTNELLSDAQVIKTSERIARAIDTKGYNLNFAPVYDNGINTSVIGNRAFSDNEDTIVDFGKIFLDVHHESGIYGTVKHFPGHGYVEGDTHKNLQTVDGALPELNVFTRALDANPVFIMVGHLAVDGGVYDSQGRPSTIAKSVSTELLRKDLGYEGIVITDAMNMGALDGFGNVDIQALDAGADIILMPRDLDGSYKYVYDRIAQDDLYRELIFDKVKRIVRAKIIRQWSAD